MDLQELKESLTLQPVFANNDVTNQLLWFIASALALQIEATNNQTASCQREWDRLHARQEEGAAKAQYAGVIHQCACPTKHSHSERCYSQVGSHGATCGPCLQCCIPPKVDDDCIGT